MEQSKFILKSKTVASLVLLILFNVYSFMYGGDFNFLQANTQSIENNAPQVKKDTSTLMIYEQSLPIVKYDSIGGRQIFEPAAKHEREKIDITQIINIALGILAIIFRVRAKKQLLIP